jgi:hypothetical protein
MVKIVLRLALLLSVVVAVESSLQMAHIHRVLWAVAVVAVHGVLVR